MASKAPARRVCQQCNRLPVREAKSSRCWKCHKERHCLVCRVRAPHSSKLGWCQDCLDMMERWNAAWRRSLCYRPDDEFLAWLLAYYAQRAAAGLPLFNPNPREVYFASCPPPGIPPRGEAAPMKDAGRVSVA